MSLSDWLARPVTLTLRDRWLLLLAVWASTVAVFQALVMWGPT